MFKKLKRLPASIAAGAMVLCLFVGVTLGNGNALRDASQEAQTQYAVVTEYVDAHRTIAGNLLTLCGRYAADDPAVTEMKVAMEQSYGRGAKSLHAMDERLTFAFASAVTAVRGAMGENAGHDGVLLTGLADEFDSARSKLNREANTYNDLADGAQEVYGKLPMRFLLGGVPEDFR